MGGGRKRKGIAQSSNREPEAIGGGGLYLSVLDVARQQGAQRFFFLFSSPPSIVGSPERNKL